MQSAQAARTATGDSSHTALPTRATGAAPWWGAGTVLAVTRGRPTGAVCALLIGVSFLAYAPVWNAYFVADDFAYTSLYANRPLSFWTEIAAADWTHGIWGIQFDEMRSAMGLAFWLDGRLWPLHPAGYHFTNLLFHAGSVLIIFFVALAMFPEAFGAAMLSALLFALHPAHAEAVCWISGRADPMCAFFSLASLLAYVRYRERGGVAIYALALAAFAGALFSKEIAIVFPLLPLGYDWFRKHRVHTALLGYFGLAIAYLLLRRSVFPHALREDQLHLAVVWEFAVRQLEYLHFLIPAIPAKVAAVLVAAVLVMHWRRWEVLFLGIWWYLVCVAPLLVTYSSPRHLYLASAGLCLVIPKLLPRRGFAAAGVLLVVMCGALLVRENLQWREAGGISDSLRASIERFAGTLPDGAGLILDIPEGRRDAFLWLSSLPFALQPPFSSGAAYSRLQVVERPLSYRYWSGSPEGGGRTWIGDRVPVIRNLVLRPTPCYWLSLDRNGDLTESPVSQQELTQLLTVVAGRDPHGSIFPLNEAWKAYWENEKGRR